MYLARDLCRFIRAARNYSPASERLSIRRNAQMRHFRVSPLAVLLLARTDMNIRLACAVASILLLSAGAVGAAPILVFETDFNGPLAPEISPGAATLTGVQG